jgi:hypothetical protein
MLAKVFEIILDYVERRAYASNMIRCEVVTHSGYGVPESAFPDFFDVVAETVRDLDPEPWDAPTRSAWRDLLIDLRSLAGAAPANA